MILYICLQFINLLYLPLVKINKVYPLWCKGSTGDSKSLGLSSNLNGGTIKRLNSMQKKVKNITENTKVKYIISDSKEFSRIMDKLDNKKIPYYGIHASECWELFVPIKYKEESDKIILG